MAHGPAPHMGGRPMPGHRPRAVNISPPFGSDQMAKPRACDGLKYGTANLYFAVMAPIKLPTWDHIAQMAAIARQNKLPPDFF